MTTPVAPDPVTIRSVPDLLGVIPSLLHFHPHESMVLVVLDGGSLVVTARVDLEEGLTSDDLTAQLGPLWLRYPSSHVLAVAYTTVPWLAWAALDELDAALPDGLDLACYHADGQRWYAGPDDAGEPYDVTTTATAAHATFAGLRVEASREAVAASIASPPGSRDARAAARRVIDSFDDAESLIERALVLVGDHRVGVPLAEADCIVLAHASRDLAFREAALLSTSPDNARTRLDLWAQVVRSTEASRSGYALVILGLAAWVAGEGALSVICQARAALVRTDEAWLDVLDLVQRGAVPPSEWLALRACWFREEVERQRSSTLAY